LFTGATVSCIAGSILGATVSSIVGVMTRTAVGCVIGIEIEATMGCVLGRVVDASGFEPGVGVTLGIKDVVEALGIDLGGTPRCEGATVVAKATGATASYVSNAGMNTKGV